MARRVRPPHPEHLKFLAPFGARITELALATRKLVLEEAPEASELIYDAYNAVASGYSFTVRPGNPFIHIAAYANWVNLGFNYGKALPDPEGLLQGVGRFARHIRISALEDLKKPAVLKLVQSAIAMAERPPAKVDAISIVRAVYPIRRRPGARVSRAPRGVSSARR
ncbi:MAG TPA: DUF1801 domain-containing protein [Bryobacteraceae bacterium]|nr:DUF1801 domain-containing protein [Bryobacteraceae bacterium]